MKRLQENGVVRGAFAALALCAAGAVRADISHSYITNGLAVWFDGIDNAGAGSHSTSPSAWADLTGNGNDGKILKETLTWGDTGWVNSSDGSPIQIETAVVRDAWKSRNFTVEFAATPSRSTSRQAFYSHWYDSGSSIEHNSGKVSTGAIRVYFNGDPDWTSNVTVTNAEKTTLSVVATPTERSLFKNGTLAGTDTSSITATDAQIFSTSSSSKSIVGGDPKRSNMAFRGTYHAFRCYNRVLSTNEVAVNAASDRVRLLGVDKSTVTLPDGYMFDDDTNILFCVSATAPEGDGTVSMDGGAAVQEVSSGYALLNTVTNVTLKATPVDGKTFFRWTGDTWAITSGSAFSPTITVSSERHAELRATFVPLVDRALVWNGADGAAWDSATETNWLDGETPSAWIDGSNAFIPAGASILVTNLVTVSNITAEGAMTINGTTVVPCPDVYLTASTEQNVFPGMTLDDIDGQYITANMAGSYVDSTKYSARAYHFIRSGTTATAQFQMSAEGHFRGIRVTFTEKPDGVYAIVDPGESYFEDDGTTHLGQDMDYFSPGSDLLATSLNGKGLSICDLGYSPSRVRVTGVPSFDGALTLVGATAEFASERQSFTMPALDGTTGSVVVRGSATAAEDTTYGLTDSSMKWAAAYFATERKLPGVILSRTTIVGGVMGGGSMGFLADASPYHVKFDGVTMTCQMQFQATSSGKTYVKGCLLQMVQDGTNVNAVVLQSYYHNGGTLGEDLLNTSGVETYAAGENCLKNLVLRSVPMPDVMFWSVNDYDAAVIDNAKVSFAYFSARPNWNIIARNNAVVVSLRESGGGGCNAVGDGRIYAFNSGSLFIPYANMVSDGNAKYIFDASTIYTPWKHGSWLDGSAMFRHVVMRNGSRAVAYPLRCGEGTGLDYASEGTGTNEIASGICLYNDGDDLKLKVDAPLLISGKIYNPESSVSASVTKSGSAPLILSGANSFAGTLTVAEGSLELLYDDNAAATANAGGTLNISSGATLKISRSKTLTLTSALACSAGATLDFDVGGLDAATPALSLSGLTLPASGKVSVRVTGRESGSRILLDNVPDGVSLASFKLDRTTVPGGSLVLVDNRLSVCTRGFMFVVR